MTTPTQGELRAWARSKGIAVGDRGSLPAAVKSAYAAAHGTPPADAVINARTPSAPGDLAGGLRGFLDAVDTEVRACSALSEHIDVLVGDLNRVREEKAQRLTTLDALQSEATDPKLKAFLAKIIKPTATQVAEIVPARLR